MPEKGKPNFALLIGKPKMPSSGEADESDDMGDAESAEDSALSDIISAVHAKDTVMLKDALKDFLSLCYPQLEHDEEEEPQGEESSEY